MGDRRSQQKIVDEFARPGAMIWDVDVDGVIWEDANQARSSNVGDFPAIVVQGRLAAKKALTGGRSTARRVGQRRRPCAGFSTQCLRCRGRYRDRQGDDPALCRRQTSASDPPSYSRQSSGVAQASAGPSTEEYIYDRNGRLDNAGFLDYRVPVASDMPMIERFLARCRTRPTLRRRGWARSTSVPRWRDRQRDRPAPSTAA